MRIKHLFFIFGTALMVSLGVFSSPKNFYKASAEAEVIDVGIVKVDSVRNQVSSNKEIYLIPTKEIELPDSWDDQYRYTPVSEADGVFINGKKDNNAHIKHAGIGIQYVTFYVGLAKTPAKNAIVDICGTWSCPGDETHPYKFTFQKCTLKWTGSKWEKQVDLGPYDKISLIDTCFDDVDDQSFDSTYLSPGEWNTFVTSEENTNKSFSVEFTFEAHGPMTTSLQIKVGNSGPYDAGHYYLLELNNTWGDSIDDPSVLGGVIVFYERDEEEIKKPTEESKNYRCSDLRCNLETGKHTIEFGSIYVQDSTDTFNFVKYDGQYLYQEVREPINHNRTTKVGYYYGGNNISIGSTTTQKENNQVIKFNRLSADGKGIYFDALENDIPSGSEVKGAPASKYNILLNGSPMYTFGSNPAPMTKVSAEEDSAYYLNLTSTGVNFKEGDVITISDEFHFYAGNKAYSMSIYPVSLLYSNNQFTQIDDIYAYFINKLAEYNVPEDYDADKLEEIVQIIEDAESKLPTMTRMKDLWNMYLDYVAQLKAIPYNAEKQQAILHDAKEAAIAELSALADSSKYSEDNFATVQGYINDAIAQINSEETDTVEKVQTIVNTTINLVEAVETIQQHIEKAIMESESDVVPDEYLEDYEVVTTTDLCAVGSMVFRDEESGSYGSGGYDDTTTRIATSPTNLTGNMIFKFAYESDDPSARYINEKGVVFGSQIYIRMRTESASTCYRFDIATETGEEEYNSGVALSTLIRDVAVGRIIYDAKLKPNTPYNIECGAIDLDGDFNRTMLFVRIDGKMVIKTIVDSLEESKPAIRIMDSFVKEDHVATMSPIEEGTTKANYSSLLGRLILDESSNQKALQASLRDNNVEVGTTLFPVEEGAFKVNGQEIQSSRASTRIEKTAQNKYLIVIDNREFEDGDQIFIGGYFGVFDTKTFVKSIVRLFDTTFTYHASTDSWTQEAVTDPETIVYEAKETIRNCVDLSEYSHENASQIEELIEFYCNKVDSASSADEVPMIVEEALRVIGEIHTILDDYKEAAINELKSYRSADLYRDEEKQALAEILTDAELEIRGCNDQDAVDRAVQEAKAKIDKLKTSEQRDAEDLAIAKSAATSEIQSYSSLIQMNRYSDANADLLAEMTYKALSDVENATSIEQINSIVSKYKEDVKNVETEDGSTFDGEKYIEKPAAKKNSVGAIVTISVISSVVLIGVAVAIILVIKKSKEKKQ